MHRQKGNLRPGRLMWPTFGAMAQITDAAIDAVRSLCDERLRHADPAEVRLDVDVGESAISIVERHPPFPAIGEWTATALAQLRLEDDDTWTLYVADDDGGWGPVLRRR